MNNSNKGRLNQAKRNKSRGQKSTTFNVDRTIQGGRATYERTFNLQNQPRKSKVNCGKVARHGNQNKRDINQIDIIDAESAEMKKIEIARIIQLSPKEILNELPAPTITKDSVVEKVI